MIKQIHLNQCDSTQDILKEQLSRSGDEYLVVSCEHQLHGRGRGANSWIEMPGSLCFSLSVHGHRIPSFTAIEMSLLIANFFSQKGKNLGLKWPNDLWNEEGLKCGGILVQNSGSKMLAGIGLNLYSDQKEFGGIFEESFEFDKKTWAQDIAEFILNNRYADTQQLKNDWEKRCVHFHKKVVITENSERYEGAFYGLGEHGEALLNNVQEGIQHIYNGTLRLL
ncbi:MAG: biotin--[acetyl-CoA-carboxylase] ligase [Bacteriovoracaceae bacterium]